MLSPASDLSASVEVMSPDHVHCARAGPKDLPVVARYLGRLTGSASAFVSRARHSFGAFSDQTELTQVVSAAVSCTAPHCVTCVSDLSLCPPVSGAQRTPDRPAPAQSHPCGAARWHQPEQPRVRPEATPERMPPRSGRPGRFSSCRPGAERAAHQHVFHSGPLQSAYSRGCPCAPRLHASLLPDLCDLSCPAS